MWGARVGGEERMDVGRSDGVEDKGLVRRDGAR